MCFLLSSVLFAGPVSKQQAQEIASRFMTGKTHRAPSTAAMQTQVVLNAVDNVGQPLLYAVTMGSEQGFVLVSGDDRFRSVLGYSDSGSFDAAAMPENMKSWLQGYVEEMKHLDAIGYQPSLSSTHRAAGDLKTAIAPLIQTWWDQDAPYNLQINNSTYFAYTPVVTGCVATAMAQVMYYTAMKAGLSSSSTLVDIPSYKTKYGFTIPLVSAGTVIDWSKMKNTYAKTETGESADAVATLMRCCGVSVKMNYANPYNGGSGASSENIPYALKTYFGFDETTRFANRASYSLADWTELIYDELKAGRPVIYGGQSSGGGHEFVVDGYDGDEMFHVNWGWSGGSDGFFALSVMNPGDNSGIGASTSNDGYSYGQDAIVGIQIGSGEVYEEDMMMTTDVFTLLDATTIRLDCGNTYDATYSFDYGIGYIDGEGAIEPISYGSYTMPSGSGFYGAGYYQTYTINGSSKAAGTYKIVPIGKLTSKSKWITDVNPDLRYIEAVFDGAGHVTLTAHPTLDLTATSINFTGTKYKDEPQPVEVTVQNNGDEYYGQLYLFASTTDSKGDAVNTGGITVQAGKSASLVFEWTPSTTGNYNIWVATDDAGSNVIGTTTVSITVNPHAPAGPFIISALEVENADETSWTTDGDGNFNVDVYSQQITVAPTIKNISSSNYSITAYFYLQKYNGSTWVDQDYPPYANLTISAGAEMGFAPITFGTYDYGKYRVVLRVNETDYDTRYILNLTMGYTTINSNGDLVRVKTGSTAVSVADDQVAVDLTGFNYTSVTPNSNPNTLYIISGSQTAPASLSGKNVVKGGNIANLTLTDGYAFYSPIDFHADKVTYKRTFTNFYNAGSGWSTVVLPFEATVSNADGPLAWEEPNRQFWLMEFSSDAGSTVKFAHATGSTMQANVPYIIALPDDAYGAYSLVGKNAFTFTGTDIDFKAGAKAARTGSKYKFVGTTTNATREMYKLNAAGSAFKLGNATEYPFRAYFTGTSLSSYGDKLSIGFEDNGATSINSVKSDQNSQLSTPNSPFFNLNGQRVGHPAKGLYIVNGKKVVIK